MRFLKIINRYNNTSIPIMLKDKLYEEKTIKYGWKIQTTYTHSELFELIENSNKLNLSEIGVLEPNKQMILYYPRFVMKIDGGIILECDYIIDKGLACRTNRRIELEKEREKIKKKTNTLLIFTLIVFLLLIWRG